MGDFYLLYEGGSKMLVEKLSEGESKTLEYKESVPENSQKYMKTVVAFANGNGGKIVFGVKDKNYEITGIESENIFELMDSITNAVSDSCEPLIIPDITVQTINDKTVIVMEIDAGKQTPYYIKSSGIKKGTYVRVAGTTRLADDYTIKDLLFEGANRSYDQAPTDIEITEEEINNFCSKLKEIASKNSNSKSEIKDVTKNILLSWGILTEKNNKIIPSNAYILLAENIENHIKIQCGVFKGKTRAIFVDRREFSGSIINQLEEAYKYVLSKINLGAEINGLYRKDVYEFPVESIREIIANAVVHRNYLEPNDIQVALYDDRLEVTSPGGLPKGVTIDKIKSGYSKVRNRAIANVFAYLEIIEKWGSGIPRIFEEFKKYGLREPELIDFEGDFRINLYRNTGKEQDSKETDIINLTNKETNKANITNKAMELSDTDKNIIESIMKNPFITQNEIASDLNLPMSKVKYYIMRLREKNVIKRNGGRQKGEWEINETNIEYNKKD